MERIFAFFLGFITVGMIGWLSNSILMQYKDNNPTPKILKKRFLEVLLRSIVLVVLLLILFVCIRTLILFLATPQHEIYELGNTIIFGLFYRWSLDFLYGILAGIIFAFVLGIILRQTLYNLSTISNLHQVFLPSKAKDLKEWETKKNKSFDTPSALPQFENSDIQAQKIDDLQKQIKIKNRRLQKLKETEALYGKAVDPSVSIEIENIEKDIRQLEDKLKKLHNKIDKASIKDNMKSNIG